MPLPSGRIRVNVTGARGALGIDLQGSPTPGQILTKAPGSGRTFNAITPVTTPANAVALTDLSGANGANLVGVGNRTLSDKLSESVSVKDTRFAGGAKGDGTTNDGAAILAAVAYVRSQGGGEVRFPRGTYSAPNLTIQLGTEPIRLVGSSSGGSVISGSTLITGTSADVGEPNLTVEHLGFTATGGVGLTLRTIARFSFEHVFFAGSTIGLDIQGSLTGLFYKCRTNGSPTGVRARKYGTLPPNLLSFYDHEARGCAQWAFDIDDGEAFSICNGSDLSGNGTPGNIGTGFLKFGPNMSHDPQVGWSKIAGCYIEANYGNAILCENSQYLALCISDTNILSTEEIGGIKRCITIGTIASSLLTNVVMGSTNDTVAINAVSSVVLASKIPVLNDLSIDYWHRGVQTATEVQRNAVKTGSVSFERTVLPSGQLYTGRSAAITGGNGYEVNYQSGSDIVNYGRGAVRTGPGTVGFCGADPVPKQTATDLASALAALKAFGLIY